MSPEIEERLEKYLDAIEQSVSTAGDFVLEQAPLVVQEYLQWMFWQSLVTGICGFVVIIAVWIIAFRSCPLIAKASARREPDSNDILFAKFVRFLMACTATGLLGIPASSLFTALKVYIAPRVVLLEKIGELLP